MIQWLLSLKLSISQWTMATGAAAIGLLVVMLRIQGSRLHRAQIDALAASVAYANGQEDAKLVVLKAKLEQSIQEYERAK